MAIRGRPLARIFVRPPERPSEGAQTIRNALGDLARLSRVPPSKQYRLVINWGNGTGIAVPPTAKVLNGPEYIRRAVNKKTAFDLLKAAGVQVPQFSTEKPTVKKGEIWLARKTLTGSGGVGIVPIRHGDAVPDAPLYVRYIRKKLEYRVHVANGEAVFAQLKKRKSETEQTADQKLIRNYDNGWVFCPVDLKDTSKEVKDVAIRSVSGLGLDFGAVDLVLDDSTGAPYTLEVNSAPGLSSPGLIQAYANAFMKELEKVT